MSEQEKEALLVAHQIAAAHGGVRASFSGTVESGIAVTLFNAVGPRPGNRSEPIVVPPEACTAILRLKREADSHWRYLELGARQALGLGPEDVDEAEVEQFCRELDDWDFQEEELDMARLEASEGDDVC